MSGTTNWVATGGGALWVGPTSRNIVYDITTDAEI